MEKNKLAEANKINNAAEEFRKHLKEVDKAVEYAAMNLCIVAKFGAGKEYIDLQYPFVPVNEKDFIKQYRDAVEKQIANLEEQLKKL